MTLLHVMTDAEWARLQRDGEWQPAPFWHLCTPAQLPFVLNRFFAGRSDIVVMETAETPDIRWEISEPGMEPFPHLYGTLRAKALRLYER